MQWLKLQADILNDDKINMIRSMPDGDSLFVLWIGLLCIAMNKETNQLWVAEGVPYTPDIISRQLSLPKNTVQMGLDTFTSLHMIEICDTIHIKNFEKYQSLESIERNRELTRARMKKHREKKKIEAPKRQPGDKIEFGDKVKLKQKEYNTLVEKYGQPNTRKAIETLSAYKLSSGKTYKSDYGAILSWVVEKLKLKERIGGTIQACKHCGREMTGGLCVNPDCSQYAKED